MSASPPTRRGSSHDIAKLSLELIAAKDAVAREVGDLTARRGRAEISLVCISHQADDAPFQE